ncbi:Beta-(1--_2)glucan export ATP-binding/permease protein NdvA [Emticicia aquatica]|uniref:Beta-(1-->2)glucan export ATP-binding/permease protein NdvA n=1 Tax=Emticicia aquatica TaxID=1681835 RepID=A0ABM9APM7_9BACT|nr:ABC transporter ATP-binding protein [Emticicia aquatica]CAH0995786.1 Beta-(1-->2)glucan export ATP-binding/permease protein NdvA [Emticicia aquatica]
MKASNSKNPYISLLQTAWKYAKKERKRYVLIYGMFAMANVVFSMNPILFGWFINKIQQDYHQTIKFTLLYVLGYLGLKLLEWSFHGPARVMERQLAFNLSRNFLQEMYHQALHLPVKWHQDHHSGSTINRIRKAYEALKNFFQNGFMFLHALSKFAFSFGAMLYFSPIFGSIGILIGIFTIWIIFKFDKPFIKTLDEVNEKEHVVSSTLFDSLSNIITVITLRLEKSMELGLLGKVQNLLPPFRRNVLINEWKWFTADMLVGLTYVVITFGYVYQNYEPNKVFLVGGLVTLLGFVNQFTSVFHDVAWQYTEIVQYNTDIQTARSISEDYNSSHRPETTISLPNNWKEIRINNLSFSHRETYDEAHAPQSLHDISIKIERGKKIAFIGESGSGKSTLLALLRGLYEPQSTFKFSVDGKDFQMATLNETVTLFPQEPEIFENSIRFNITLGLPFEEDDVWKVCDEAYFTDTAKQLPNGLESNIQEKGVNLSGGQKQRLALARGILAAQSSEVVLMDEPTSSVDPKTEALIYKQLFKTFSEKAIISSLHRLHLLRYFDYVYVLNRGKIVAEGTFEDLKSTNSYFQELWKHQENE